MSIGRIDLPAGNTGFEPTIWVIRKGASTSCREGPPVTVTLLKFDILLRKETSREIHEVREEFACSCKPVDSKLVNRGTSALDLGKVGRRKY